MPPQSLIVKILVSLFMYIVVYHAEETIYSFPLESGLVTFEMFGPIVCAMSLVVINMKISLIIQLTFNITRLKLYHHYPLAPLHKSRNQKAKSVQEFHILFCLNLFLAMFACTWFIGDNSFQLMLLVARQKGDSYSFYKGSLSDELRTAILYCIVFLNFFLSYSSWKKDMTSHTSQEKTTKGDIAQANSNFSESSPAEECLGASGNRGVWLSLSGGGIRACSFAVGALGVIEKKFEKSIRNQANTPLRQGEENNLERPNTLLSFAAFVERCADFDENDIEPRQCFREIAALFLNEMRAGDPNTNGTAIAYGIREWKCLACNNNTEETLCNACENELQNQPSNSTFLRDLLLKLAFIDASLPDELNKMLVSCLSNCLFKLQGVDFDNFFEKLSQNISAREFFFNLIAAKYIHDEGVKKWGLMFVSKMPTTFHILLGEVENNLISKHTNSFKINDNIFSLRGISTVSGGGYAGSSYLLWKKWKEGKENWFELYETHMKNNISFLINWGESDGNLLKRVSFHVLGLFHGFFDSIWAVVFIVMVPKFFSVACITPYIIILSGVFRSFLVSISSEGEFLPFTRQFCLKSDGLSKIGHSVTWIDWVTNIEKCKHNTQILKNESCSTVYFHDPFPSAFVFSGIGSIFVILLSLLHHCRYHERWLSFDGVSSKGTIKNAIVVFALSALGTYVSWNVESYKCHDDEKIFRLFLYLTQLLSLLVSLFSWERYGGVLTIFVASSIFLFVDEERSGISEWIALPNWLLKERDPLVTASLLLFLSPILNFQRFFSFSNYYRHRISLSYYPLDDNIGDLQSQNKFICFVDWTFAFFRFPFSIRRGLFYINESMLGDLDGAGYPEYISQISVHNISDLYDHPKAFMSDSAISKDMLIASSKHGYRILRKGENSEELKLNNDYEASIRHLRQKRGLKHQIQSIILKPPPANMRIETQVERDNNKKRILQLLTELLVRSSTQQVKKKIEFPHVATVTAVSGGAFSPQFGDQAPNSPASFISLFGGFCGRWINVKQKARDLYMFEFLFSNIRIFLAGSLIWFAHYLDKDCQRSFTLCKNSEFDQIRDMLFTVERYNFAFMLAIMIFVLLFPKIIQEWDFASHPFILSVISILSIPFKWSQVNYAYASDGGHYENLGVIPLLVHRDLGDGDVIFSIDGSEEESINCKDEDIRIDRSQLLTPEIFSSLKFGDFVQFRKMGETLEGFFLERNNSEECTLRIGTIEKFIDFPSTLFTALKLVRDYDSTRYKFTFEVNDKDLCNYLGRHGFKKLTMDHIELFSNKISSFIPRDDPNQEFKSNSELQQIEVEQEKKRRMKRSSYLKIRVTRHEFFPRGIELSDEKVASTSSITLYHIRPRSEDEQSPLFPGFLNAYQFSNRNWKLSFHFNSICLYIKQLFYASVMLILFIVWIIISPGEDIVS